MSGNAKHISLKTAGKAVTVSRMTLAATNAKVAPLSARRSLLPGQVNLAELNEEGRWIVSHINKRVCSRFVVKKDAKGNPTSLPASITSNKKQTSQKTPRTTEELETARQCDPVCHCGYARSTHTDKAKRAESSEPWRVNKDTEVAPTDAFGDIEFVGFGQKIGKYVRVDHRTDMDTMLTLMMDYWQLDKPNLLISVTGGAKNFHMRPRLKEVFRRGLMKAAESTGAWIVTGGMHAGVMKHVGEAVRDHMMVNGSKTKVTAIGIAPWGCVNNKEGLIDPNGSWPSQYRHEEPKLRKQAPIDINHSHFIMVDNGTQHQYATEIQFRTKLEYTISKMKTDMGDDAVSVPVVCVALEGGPGTLETVKSAIQNGTPAVVVEGSGRAADILAYAYTNSKEEEIEVIGHGGERKKRVITIIDQKLEHEIQKMIEHEWTDKDLTRRVGWVKECLQKRELMTVFRLDAKGSAKDIDIAILHALLKANKEQDLDQLKLALAWNRIDVAKSEIFVDDKNWETGELDDIMYTALLNDRVDFCKLFMENGLDLRDFLTTRKLLLLYNNIPSNSLLYSVLIKKKAGKKGAMVSLEDVGQLIKRLMGDFFNPLYLRDGRYTQLPVEEMLELQGSRVPSELSLVDQAEMADDAGAVLRDGRAQTLVVDKATGQEYMVPDFDEPARDLFIWSILLLRKDMAMLFWDEGKENIAAALTAQKLLGAMKQFTVDAEQEKNLTSLEMYFGDLAQGVLASCYAAEERKAELLLLRELDHFGQATSLRLAVEADNKAFIAHGACQSLLTSIWMGKMSTENRFYHLVPCIILPPLLYILIKFRYDDDLSKHEHQKPQRRRAKTVHTQSAATPSALQVEIHKNDKHNQLELQDRANTEIGFNDDNERLVREPTFQQSMVDIRPRRHRYSCIQKFAYFFNAPKVTFIYNYIFYIGFLSLFSYILLTDFYNTIKIPEIILIVWVATLFAEEFRQLVQEDSSNWGNKIVSYIYDPWNILDILCLLSFITGLVLRAIPDNATCFEAARIILAICLMLFFFRILHIISVSKNLGPKLVMIGRMTTDTFFFMMILMVFVTAYGMAAQSILYPNAPFEAALIQDVLRKAYWQIYGELFLEEIEGQQECTFDPVLYSNNTMPRCPTNTWFVPILLGCYILITNVMMLNLLIAMFSYTFSQIQDHTDQHWYFQRYFLIKEYHDRPPLPPPFIVISHLFLLIRGCIQKCCKKCTPNNGFKQNFTESETKQLIMWENSCAEEYRRQCHAEERSSMENRVAMTNERVDTLVQQVEEIMENSFMSNMSSTETKLPPALGNRLTYLEEQMQRTSKALDWIIDSMVEKGSGSKGGRPSLPNVDKKREEEQLKIQEEIDRERKAVQDQLTKQLELHVKSRTSRYPGVKMVFRFNVPDEKVAWEVDWPEYEPVSHTDEHILSSPSYADIDLMQMEPHARPKLPFNVFDNEKKVDRRTFVDEGVYVVKDGLPLNPKGRTGMCGRGLLGRWGPNHAGDPVVTRWKKEGDRIVEEGGKPVLEFVAVQRQDSKQWALPGGILMAGQGCHTCLKAEFSDEALGSLMEDEEQKEEIKLKLDRLFSQGEEVYRGYMDDPRNTDNAWLETVAVNYHDEDGTILRHFNLRAGETVDLVHWQRLSSRQSMYAAHLSIIQKVAEKRNAAF